MSAAAKGNLSEEDVLLKIAEECAELSFECLKRVQEGGRFSRVQEEIGDVRKWAMRWEGMTEDGG